LDYIAPRSDVITRNSRLPEDETLNQYKFDAILRRPINSPPTSLETAKAPSKVKNNDDPKKVERGKSKRSK